MKAIVKSIGSKYISFDYKFVVGETFDVSSCSSLCLDLGHSRMFKIVVPGIGTELFLESNCNELGGGNWELVE